MINSLNGKIPANAIGMYFKFIDSFHESNDDIYDTYHESGRSVLGYIKSGTDGFLYIGVEVRGTDGTQLRLNGYGSAGGTSKRVKANGTWGSWTNI